ncbi:MAG: serine protease [Rhodospirillales bacterium]
MLRCDPIRGAALVAIMVGASSTASAADAVAAGAAAQTVFDHQPVASDGSATVSSPAGRRVSPSYRGRLSVGAPLDGRAEVPALSETASELKALLALPAAGPPFAGPETIIGPDTRKRVNPTTEFPARATTVITFSEGRCTGWMIGPDTVATAGHCVHSGGRLGTWRQDVVVFPGRNGNQSPYGSCTAKRLYTVAAWKDEAKIAYDYGAIKLNCDIGLTTGWYGLFWQKGSMNGLPTNINGYPGDRPLTQWSSADKVTVTQKLRLFYRNDTVGGMSGSPVWTNRDSTCPVCTMAVHTYGAAGAPPAATNNSGTRITQPVFNNLVAWSDAR